MPIQKTFDKNFFKNWTPEMAYVLGFLYADGYIQINSRKSSYACFCSTDLALIENIKKFLRSNHKIGIKIRKKNLYTLQIGSKKLCQELGSFGIVPNKSLIIRLPSVKRRYLGDFVRGYFDGDGCVHLGRYWVKSLNKMKWQFILTFTSGSRVFLEQLLLVLKNKVQGGFIKTKKRGFELVFSQNDAFALFNLMYHNVPAGMFLERKHKIFLKAFRVLRAGVV